MRKFSSENSKVVGGKKAEKFSSGSFNLIKVMNITFSKRLNVIRDFHPLPLPPSPTFQRCFLANESQIKWKSLVLILRAMKIKTRKIVIEKFLSPFLYHFTFSGGEGVFPFRISML
jgi:hypothetical protein